MKRSKKLQSETQVVATRISPKMATELNQACSSGDYAPTRAMILKRGIKLALLELKQRKKLKNGGDDF
jgi:hypothetical protein